MNLDHQCRWVKHRLPLLAGGELGVEERRKVERHLIGCADCRGRRDASTGALEALRLLGEEPPSRRDAPSLWPSLARQIRQSRHASPPMAWWEGPLPRPWGVASLATALGVVLAASIASPPPDFEEVETPAPPAIVSAEPPAAPLVEARTPMVAEAQAPAPSRSRRKPLPDGPGPGELTRAAIKPIEPPSSILRFDYDLDHGTPMTSGSQDPQRTF